MAKGAYIGVGNSSHKLKNIYAGVGNVSRKVKKAYIGVGGVSRLWWKASLSMKIYPHTGTAYYFPSRDVRTVITTLPDYVVGPPLTTDYSYRTGMWLSTLNRNFVENIVFNDKAHIIYSGAFVASTGTYALTTALQSSNTSAYDYQEMQALNNSLVWSDVHSNTGFGLRIAQPGSIGVSFSDYGIAAFVAGIDETSNEIVLVGNNLIATQYEDVGAILPAYSAASKCGPYVVCVSTGSAGAFNITNGIQTNIYFQNDGYWGPRNPTYDLNGMTMIPWQNMRDGACGINTINANLVTGMIANLPSGYEIGYGYADTPWRFWSEAIIGEDRIYLASPAYKSKGIKIDKNLVCEIIDLVLDSSTTTDYGAVSFNNSFVSLRYAGGYYTTFNGYTVVN